MTLVDMVGKTVKGIIENWQPAPPEPEARPQIIGEPAGMGYCWHCGNKSFALYTVWVDIGDNLGARMRPMKLHGHDECVGLLARAYQQEVAANHEWDFAAIEASWHMEKK